MYVISKIQIVQAIALCLCLCSKYRNSSQQFNHNFPRCSVRNRAYKCKIPSHAIINLPGQRAMRTMVTDVQKI